MHLVGSRQRCSASPGHDVVAVLDQRGPSCAESGDLMPPRVVAAQHGFVLSRVIHSARLSSPGLSGVGRNDRFCRDNVGDRPPLLIDHIHTHDRARSVGAPMVLVFVEISDAVIQRRPLRTGPPCTEGT